MDGTDYAHGMSTVETIAHGRVLVVDDDPELCAFYEAGLRARSFATASRRSVKDAISALETESFDLVLTDLMLEGSTGLELCRWVCDQRPELPIVVMTAYGDIETAVTAIQAGAYDFITKPLELDALKLTLDRAMSHRELRAEVTRLRTEVGRVPGFEELIGTSPAMRKLYDVLDRIRDSDASVLISGESGTGKEVVARVLHRTSRRSAGPFVAVNCAAIPEALLESELFGHAKGAFTDARTRRAGLLQQSSGGTLFLDEIGDMPLGLQPKLLRALQERTVRPVGGDVEVPFDARIITATHRDIESAIEEGHFREDLYFRINVVHIALPPLRARGTDVLVLADRFRRQFATQSGKAVTGVSNAAGEKLSAYPWPGNVRELMNCIERAVALTRNRQIELEDLPDRIREYSPSHVIVAADDPSDFPPLEVVERRYIHRVLESVAGNKSVAARVLGIDRKTLYRKLSHTTGTSSEPPPSDDGAEPSA